MAYRDKAQQAAAARRHYVKNAAKMKARARAYTIKQRRKLRAIVIEKKARPCADCGVQYPSYVMDYDHLKDKDRRISMMVLAAVSVSKLLAEIEKCDVVCANCHRQRTHDRALSKMR